MTAMKKIALSILILLLSAVSAMAVPATPYPVKYRQPDGTVIELRIHGDEFFSYTTCKGQVVAKDARGFYVPALKPVPDMARIKARRAESRAAMRGSRRGLSPSPNGETRHFLVILVDFPDLRFTLSDPRSTFSNMLNQQGFSYDGATGSAGEYYRDNSNGRFNPVFDVAAPVTVSKGYAEYGGKVNEDIEDKDVPGMVREACRLLDATVDFSEYDYDGDGFIDNIFVFYAGYSQAEGAGDDFIWPHASGAYDPDLVLDGKYLSSYACGEEYRGTSGRHLTGIGTFCHEFGHVLGLPDYYDTDNEKNGSTPGLYNFSLMSTGCYNNNGHTPPYLGAMERLQLGWIPFSLSTSAGPVTLSPVQEDAYLATPSSVEGEYFLYEVRNGEGWDKSLILSYGETPARGLVIYHVDQSQNPVGTYTAADLWELNSINNYEDHPCYKLELPYRSFGSIGDMVYPGNYHVTSFEGTGWDGLSTGYSLSGISYTSGKVSFTLSDPTQKSLVGRVTGSSGNPLPDVLVSSQGCSARTDASGRYELVLPASSPETVSVEFTKEMYRPLQLAAKFTAASFRLDATLYSVAEGVPVNLGKHGRPAGAVGFSEVAESYSATLAVRFKPMELVDYRGYTLQNINFILYGDTAERVDVFVDFDTERVLTTRVDAIRSGNRISVDISDAELRIPADKTIFVGVSVKGITEQWWMGVDSGPAVEGGGVMLGDYTSGGSRDWFDSGFNFLIDCDIVESVTALDALGVYWIPNPGKGAYPLNSSIELKLSGIGSELPTKVEWFYDGHAVSGGTQYLRQAGKHVVKALLSYQDGSTEEIEQTILVQ